MSSEKKMTMKSLSEELEKVKLDVKELHNLKKEVKELQNEVKEAKEEVKKLKKECESKNIGNESLCDVCKEKISSKELMKQHKKEIHKLDLKCKHCDEKFMQAWMLEVHLKSHKDAENFECNICKKTFQLKWRLSKHKDIHNNSNTKRCHYFNNGKPCPYQEVGCMFLHEISEVCYLGNNCRNRLCPFQHKSLEEKKAEEHQENDDGETSENKSKKNMNKEKEKIHDVILKAFEKDAGDHFCVNNECGLNNESQKCSRCKFITHSMGLLRMHEKKSHKVYNNFEKIIDGFKFDNKKFFEVLSAMYNGKELYTNECEKCDFKTHSDGLLKLHITNSHEDINFKVKTSY